MHKGSRPYGFWQHEYEKHGSCATDLPQLDTQEEYFRQGIEWNKRYDLADMLDQADITPGGNYTWLEVYTAVKRGLGGRKPAVQCEHDKELNLKTLAQIYICFDKNLRLTDCTGISGGINIGCPRKDRFYFPGPAR